MTDVFISYSRKDKAFVQKLHQAIEAEGKETWVDWEGIPLTADWWAEIQEGIETADSFVFIISPDSATSKVCAQEVDHATAHKKRIVPIVYRDTPDVPKNLSHLNWIFFRENDNFENAFKILMTTMDTDLLWVKAHTRLIQRAVEWDKKGRSDSFVLRGEDLVAAERMLAQTEKEPKLTELQAAYILASRQSATRRQRLTTAAVSLGLIVAVILGLLAFSAQRRAVAGEQRALAAQTEAEAQARQARQNQARLLAAQAESILDQKLRSRDLALLLAREAGQTTWAVDGDMVKEAKAVLQRALSELWRVTLTHDYLGNPSVLVSFLRLSPDGRQVVIQANPVNDNWMALPEVWDTMTGQRLTIESDGENFISFSPDGSKLLASTFTDPPALRVRDTATGKAISEVPGEFEAFSEDGSRLLVNEGGSNQIWDTSSGTLLSEVPGEFKAFSQDGSRLLVNKAGSNQIWDTSSGTLLSEVPGEFKAFSQDGRKLVVDDGSASLSQVWDTDKETLLSEWPGTFMAFSPDGTKILTSSDSTFDVWDTSTNTSSNTPLYSGNLATAFCIGFSGNSLKLQCSPSSIVPPCSNPFIVDIKSGEETHLCNFTAMSFDGTKLISENQNSYALVDTVTGDQIELPGKFLALSPNGATVVVDRGFNAILMLDTASPLSPLPPSPEGLLAAATQALLRTPPEFTPAEREEFGLK